MADEGDVVVDIAAAEPLVRSIRAKLQVIDDEAGKKAPHTIYRVFPKVREIGSVAYDPQVISIGPFHRMKDELQPMERHKWRFLGDLIQRSRGSTQNLLEKYIQRLRSLEAWARSCYSEQIVPDDSNAFVEMMLLDCCFIIEFLYKWYKDDVIALLKLNLNLPLLRNDLLLLENQIPFFVLQSLYDLSVVDGHHITLTEVALYYFNKGEIDDVHPSIPSGVHHLLHLFHSSLRPTINSSHIPEATQGRHSAKRAIKKIKHLLSYSFFWLLSLFLNCRMPPPPTSRKSNLRKIPTATELQKAGIKFKRMELWNCRTSIDITFRNGTMKIPQLLIDAETMSLFRNLIAFEQCCATAGNHFTAYAALMNNLINTPGDVALLESYGILDCQVGSYEEVSGFFKTLGVDNRGDPYYFDELIIKVNNYGEEDIYRYRAIRWWRVMLIDYFSKPWAFISLIAASVLLILTMVQTTFAVLAYYHPPS